jgi:cell division septation protein DedD
LVKVPVQRSAQGSAPRERGQGKEDITFYDTLAKSPSSAGVAVEEAKEAKSGKAKEDVAKDEPAVPREASGKTEPGEAKSAPQGPWTVQVNAFPHERDAQNLSRKLEEKGYDAYVASFNTRGRTWYRVRVGHFASREEARAIQEELKSKEKFTEARAVSR